MDKGVEQLTNIISVCRVVLRFTRWTFDVEDQCQDGERVAGKVNNPVKKFGPHQNLARLEHPLKQIPQSLDFDRLIETELINIPDKSRSTVELAV